VELDPLGRREFFAGAGGLFLCTLAGQKVLTDRGADVEKLAAEVPVPPKVSAAGSGQPAAGAAVLAQSTGARREYWIRAEQVRWDIVPGGKDQMMDRRVKGKTKFTAYAYRAYAPNFETPLGPAAIPGPLIEADIGDTVVVNFQNKIGAPATIHPHGIFYAQEMDGAYKGRFTDPGGFVQKNRTFQYVWEARPGTEGAWLYHDHGPMDPLPVYKGLFAPLVVRDPARPRPDKEFFVFLHNLTPTATNLKKAFSCINGRAYAGNTPTLEATVGQRVAFHVYGIDDAFHTFHIHGHRWTNAAGEIVDNAIIGPGDVITAEFVEDNPGRWFYHCHVFSHLHMGMNGWYVVS
jgi:FtsP/CotA-like multicopper oxidase with cupredoxin domain